MSVDPLSAKAKRAAAIAELIETLHATDERLNEFTAGEVDTVANSAGRTMVMQRSQEYLRKHNIARQIDILNALPANIALIDTDGTIVSVNDSWRAFAVSNVLHSPRYAVGLNYLEICDDAEGYSADDAKQAAAGIRAVLAGETNSFTLEYPCHSLTEQVWFMMIVTAFTEIPIQGAMVMHLNITDRNWACRNLHESERRFNDILENVELISIMLDRNGLITYCNAYLLRISGWQKEEVIGKNWFDLFLPREIRTATKTAFGDLIDTPSQARHHENEIRVRSGERRLIRWNNSLLRSTDDEVIGIASIGEDVTDQKTLEISLSRKARELAEAMNIANLAYWEYEYATGQFFFNDQYYSLHQTTAWTEGGYRISAVSFLNRYIYPDDASIYRDQIRLAQESTDPDYSNQFEARLLDINGNILWMETRLRVERDNQGRTNRLIGVNQNITERKKAELRIKYLNRVLSVQSKINALVVRENDRGNLFSKACEIAVGAGGFKMAMIAIVSKDGSSLVPIATAGKNSELLAAIREILSTGDMDSDTMITRSIREKRSIVSNDSQKDSQVLFGRQYTEAGIHSMVILPLLVSNEAIGSLALYAGEIDFFHDEELKLLNEMAKNIAFAIDHIAKQAKLDYLAYYDALTGLANHSLFVERVTQHINIAARENHLLGICVLDLERLGNINEIFGQSGGDSLLQQLAGWLTQFTGDAGLVARVSDNEFAMLQPIIDDKRNIGRFLKDSQQALKEHSFNINGEPVHVGFRMGISLFPDDGATAETLFLHAEAALKRAKTQGSRYLFYAQTMTESVSERLRLEAQLQDALEHEQFVLHYQPKINLQTGAVTGAEALIRWNDPQSGMVHPDKFIGILEETGLIHDVGRWVLEQTVSDYMRWSASALPQLRIAVNVSPLQLDEAGFVHEIEDILSINPAMHRGLQLEITENLIMQHIETNIAKLQAIRDMGVTIAVDDFGTGFSSLAYLARLPVNTLKIDRSFINEVAVSKAGLALVKTIIYMAHSLELEVVAEGVETRQQANLLRSLNCDEIQGFLVSEAVPFAIFEERFLRPLVNDDRTNGQNV